MYDEELRLSVPTKPSTSHEGRSSRGNKGRKSPRYNKNLNRIPVGPNITCSIDTFTIANDSYLRPGETAENTVVNCWSWSPKTNTSHKCLDSRESY